MNHRARIPALLLALALLLGCAGCGGGREPVTVTIWHVYGGETESPLNDLIDTFNDTVGHEQNIRVQVGSVTNTNTIHEAVLSSAYGDPGATALPDMFVSYPKTVLALPDADILVDYRDYFSDAELADFLPAFLDEGEVNGHLTVLPVAKSMEVMFVDKTLFDRFAAATGATLDDLSTWEGLYRTAEAYTAWTDAQTPDTPNDGKVFFVHDYHFNYFQVGVESLGADFFDGDQVSFGPTFRRVWEPYARATLAGSVWLKSGYATEPLRTGRRGRVRGLVGKRAVLCRHRHLPGQHLRAGGDHLPAVPDVCGRGEARHAARRRHLHGQVHARARARVHDVSQVAHGAQAQRRFCDAAGLYARHADGV